MSLHRPVLQLKSPGRREATMAKYDRAVNEAYVEKLKALDAPTSWVIFGYEGRDKIVPQSCGEMAIDGRTDGEGGPGIDEFLANLKDDEVQFGMIKFTMGDRESKRPKFVMVAWIGPSVGVMKKAKVSIHKASVKEFFGVRPATLIHRLISCHAPLHPAVVGSRHCMASSVAAVAHSCLGLHAHLQQIHCELTVDDKELLAFEEVKKRVKSAMGADYDQGSNSRESGGAGVKKGYKSQMADMKAAVSSQLHMQWPRRRAVRGAVAHAVGAALYCRCGIAGQIFVQGKGEGHHNWRCGI